MITHLYIELLHLNEYEIIIFWSSKQFSKLIVFPNLVIKKKDDETFLGADHAYLTS